MVGRPHDEARTGGLQLTLSTVKDLISFSRASLSSSRVCECDASQYNTLHIAVKLRILCMVPSDGNSEHVCKTL